MEARRRLAALFGIGAMVLVSSCGAKTSDRPGPSANPATTSTTITDGGSAGPGPTMRRPAEPARNSKSIRGVRTQEPSGDERPGEAPALTANSYVYRYLAEGESGANLKGDGKPPPVFPDGSDEHWRVEITPKSGGRTLDWIVGSGSPHPRREHSISFTDAGVVGVPLHVDLHGTAPNLSPPPLVAPKAAVAGDVFEGKGSGSFVEAGSTIEVQCTWRLTVIAETTAEVRGKTMHAWKLHREVIEVVDQVEGRGTPSDLGSFTYTTVTDEVVVDAIGLPIHVTGREDASDNPILTYHTTFTLSLKE